MMQTAQTTHRFTIDDYYRMYEAGVFAANQRVELIQGEIVDMSPIGSKHARCVTKCDKEIQVQLVKHDLMKRITVVVQNPLRLGPASEPQPDVMLVKEKDYSEQHPGPEDVLLVIEVADTSLEYDRNVKIPLYAQAGIPEVWLVALVDDCLFAYREPSHDGYRSIERLERGQIISPVALAQIEIAINAVL